MNITTFPRDIQKAMLIDVMLAGTHAVSHHLHTINADKYAAAGLADLIIILISGTPGSNPGSLSNITRSTQKKKRTYPKDKHCTEGIFLKRGEE